MKLSLYAALFGMLTVLSWQTLAEEVDYCENIPQTSPIERFIVHKSDDGRGDGTATDKQTGLMWMRCSTGQQWDATEKTCLGDAEIFTWQAALIKAEGYVSGIDDGTASYNDWRLPNVKELASILDTTCNTAKINSVVFPNTASVYYKSSSPYANNALSAWIVAFNLGLITNNTKSTENPIRLVRSGK